MEKEAAMLARKYGKEAQREVAKEMHEFKKGKARSGPGGKIKVKNKKQAVAIGLSKARTKGTKVPSKSK